MTLEFAKDGYNSVIKEIAADDLENPSFYEEVTLTLQ